MGNYLFKMLYDANYIQDPTNNRDNRLDNSKNKSEQESEKEPNQNEISDLHNIISKQRKLIKELQHNLQMSLNKNVSEELGKMDIHEISHKNIENARKKLDYNSLVFSGGSIKGVSYCGALKVLEKYGILKNIINYAGTSAGSIVASLLAIGYSPDELNKIMMEMEMRKIFDDKIGFIRDTFNLMSDYGICEGEYICNFLQNLIEIKTGNPEYTIQDLYDDRGITLVIVGTDVTNQESMYFCPNSDNKLFSNISIKDAIRISMSIPFVFEPIIFNGSYCVDGGVLDNYPLHAFDGKSPSDPNAKYGFCAPNPHVLGLQINADDGKNEINSCPKYMESFVSTFLAENERRDNIPINMMRTIRIVTPNYPITYFDLSTEEKEKLVRIGKDATEKFINQKN